MTMEAKDKSRDAILDTKGQDSKDESLRVSAPQKTYTEDEVERKFSSQRSVLDKKIAEQEKQLQSYMAREAEWTARQKKLDDEEEEAVMDDRPAYDALMARRAQKKEEATKATDLTTREAKIAEREAEFADIIEQHQILKRTQLAAEIATEKGVSMDAILKLAKADTREAYLEVAEVLPKTNELPVILSDSGRTNRGGTDWRALSPNEKIRYALANPKK